MSEERKSPIKTSGPVVSIVSAMGSDQVIGIENRLPWHLPEDLRHFSGLTIGHPIIMGRKTYESIGRPLPKRLNIVVTRNLEYRAPGCTIVTSLREAIGVAGNNGPEEIFVIGGAEIYREALHFADKLYLTEIECVDHNQTLFGSLPGDAFFPAIDRSIWRIAQKGRKRKASGKEFKGYYYRFRVYSRRLNPIPKQTNSGTLISPSDMPPKELG